MKFDTRQRAVLQGLALICALVGAWAAVTAIRFGTLSSWEDRLSPSFVLRRDTQGEWEPRWEPTVRRERARPLVLRYETDGDLPRELDLVARIEPREALDDWSREHADADGWVRHAIHSPAVLGIAEPALVRRIAWKIGNVQPESPTARCSFFVPGDPDSEHPGAWPYFAAFAGACTVAAVALSWCARSGRLRFGTFDPVG